MRFLSLIAFGSLAITSVGCGGSSGSPFFPTQALWVPNSHGNYISEFTPSMLKSSGTPAPALINSSGDLSQPWGLAFDRHRNLWVSNVGAGGAGEGTLTMFTFAQLKELPTTPAPPATVVISGLNGPEGLEFDVAGNLWVADDGSGSLLEFTPDQLASSGSPTPNTTITSADMSGPVGIAFDRSGALWVADESNNEVLQFTHDQLEAGGAQTPNVVLQNDGSGSLDAPEPLAFDRVGNLWVGNADDPTLELGTVVEFTKGQLVSGSPTPAVTLTSTPVGSTDSINALSGLAFDLVGNLWTANLASDNSGSLAQFTTGQLKASGSPSPAVFLDSNPGATNIDEPTLITFGPLINP